MLSVEDMIGDMTSIHHQHLPRHSFIASIATLAMLKEAVASLTNGDLTRIRTIDAGLKLPLNADPEGISSFLSREMLALAISSVVSVIDNPGGFILAPSPFAN
jgi:hypothetical protein